MREMGSCLSSSVCAHHALTRRARRREVAVNARAHIPKYIRVEQCASAVSASHTVSTSSRRVVAPGALEGRRHGASGSLARPPALPSQEDDRLAADAAAEGRADGINNVTVVWMGVPDSHSQRGRKAGHARHATRWWKAAGGRDVIRVRDSE